ncbi:MAG: ectoine synthase [Lentisphaeraceae bacterium]|nr:ectoine synthase [Lentisphaeraceae bacterium]
MIVRDFNKEFGGKRTVYSDGWNSTRLILKNDNMGYSFHITRIDKDADLEMQYLNHLETVYCITGLGNITDLETGEVHQIQPGVMYALDKHDKHILRATTVLELACVFNPPVIGTEVHNADGAYELNAEEIDS